MEIFIQKTCDEAEIPVRANNGDAGYDLVSVQEKILAPLERAVIKTGIKIQIPTNYYGRVAPRSGLAVKSGIDVMAGVIDSGYRGEVGVVLINLSKDKFMVKKGAKIAQLIIESCMPAEWHQVKNLEESQRGSNGYGSSDQINCLSQSQPLIIEEEL